MTGLLLGAAFACIGPLAARAQCASSYEGVYTASLCSGGNTHTAIVEAIGPSRLLISNFADIPLGIIDTEDTVVVDLDCAEGTLVVQEVTYYAWAGALTYSGEGEHLGDSLNIVYHQWNPDGSQYICIGYARTSGAGMHEADATIPIGIRYGPSPMLVLPPSAGAGSMEIFDASGRSLRRERTDGGQVSMLMDVPPGAYVVLFTSANGGYGTARFVQPEGEGF